MERPNGSPGILDGVKVVDFGRYVAGPWCAQLLQGLGAEVLRVERPSGGEDRFLFEIAKDMGAYFLHCNRGKRSMTLNPTKPAGRAIVEKLVMWADVIIANIPDESLAAMGLDWETVHAVNPRAVLATVSTFGNTGPYAGRVGFDGIGQVMSGGTHMTGHPDDPMKSFVPWVDYGTASNLAFATVAALLGREKTGVGVRVEGSLLGTALVVAGHVITEQAVTAPNRVGTGNRHPAAGPADIVPTKDGRIIVQVVGNPIFARWAKLIGRPELVEDARYATDELRGEHGIEMSRIASEWCSTRTTAEALDELAAADVPAGPLYSPQQVLDDPHISEHLMDAAHVDTLEATVPVVSYPLRLSDGGGNLGLRAPSLSEHTQEVLASFGYTDGEIAELRAQRIV